MPLNLSVPNGQIDLKPRITVIGVGGAGGNAVSNMIRSELDGVDFVVANTDAQALGQNLASARIQLGLGVTQGLGAGARPEVGRAAAEEAIAQISEAIEGSHMVFIAAGMGGGTGTGAAPVIARAARELDILTVGVVTKPFNFEGQKRMQMAEAGIAELQQVVDTLIVIPNQNLFRIANERTTFADAFKMADDVLYSGVRGVTDLMIMPGLINLDFADIRSVMAEMGKAMMGTGEAEGETRATDAAQKAISNPLLDDVSMKGARGVLINITGGPDMTLFEVDEAANRIREEVDPDANIIFGSTFDESMTGRMRVSVVATGIDAARVEQDNKSTVISLVRGKAGGRAGGAAPAPQAAAAAPRAEAMQAVAEAAPAIEQRQQAAPVVQQPAASAPVAQAPAPVPAAAQAAAGAFIPPRAMEPGLPPVTRNPAPAGVDAMAAAGMVNNAAPAKAAPSSRPSLFERVTGIKSSKPAARQAGQASAPAAQKTEPQIAAPATAPTRQAAPPAAPQPRLNGLEGQAPTSAAGGQEDLLDIPAFLRRQAN
ncbi:MAG: cell division protein FtsZ [Alphaproteobacteria bacterium]